MLLGNRSHIGIEGGSVWTLAVEYNLRKFYIRYTGNAKYLISTIKAEQHKLFKIPLLKFGLLPRQHHIMMPSYDFIWPTLKVAFRDTRKKKTQPDLAYKRKLHPKICFDCQEQHLHMLIPHIHGVYLYFCA